ncbi:hypothetical protein H0H92_014973, partial [Tricholoma furcatifolium]
MPATRTKPKVRGLFTLSDDPPPIVAQAVTSSKSGQVRTFVSRTKPQEPENEPNNMIDDDAVMFSPADTMHGGSEFGPALSPENISGITVKAPAKRYANS